ncbi:MAG: hypothetical protein ACYC3I_20100 [Gemmataceae bacterium]
MKWFLGAVLAALGVVALGVPAGAADDKDVSAVLDKAIKALGGEEKLSKVKAATWKAKGKITFNGSDNEFTSTATVQGLDRFRSTFEGDFDGNKVTGVTILAKNKGWRQFNDNKTDMDADAVANEKRSVYLQVVPMILLPLKDKGFKVGAAGEKKVGDKPAVGLKVTAPDGKDFTLFFDKDSGLPVLLVAKVVGFMGDEYTQETSFADYKEFDGIKKAAKVVSKRDGEKFLESRIIEFKALDKIDPKTFEEPQ